MRMRAVQVSEKEYKELVIANTPPTPSPYEDGHGECIAAADTPARNRRAHHPSSLFPK